MWPRGYRMQELQVLLLYLVHLIRALTDEEKKTIVEKHNYYRSREDPQAADMKALRWDRTLEDLATSYAAKCIWDHNEERGFRGENLFLMTGSSLDVDLGMADWHRERDFYNFTTNSCQEGQMCGHYTQMVWADTERVGCGEKFCEKVEGFDDSNIHLLVCNYEPPGNFQGEKPYTPGEPCSSCPSAHACEESLCVDKSLDKEETSTDQPVLMSDIPASQLVPESTPAQLDLEQTPALVDPEPSQLDPEPSPSQLDLEPTTAQLAPNPTPSQLVLEPTPSQLDLKPTPSQLDLKPTPSQLDLEPTPSQLDLEPTQSKLVQEATPHEQVLETTKAELDPDSAKSEMVPKSTWTSPVPLSINIPHIRENSIPDGIEQSSIQPLTQVIAHPSQEDISASVSPSLPLDSAPHIDKTAIHKAYSNDEPDVPTEEERIIPVTLSVIPTKPARAHDTSVLVDKDKKVLTKASQDVARRKDIQQPSKVSAQKKKLKNMNLTSIKQKNQLSSSTRWNYKSVPPVWTYFGRPVQVPHFIRAPRLCPYPCLSSQSPLVFPLHRTNHILPMGEYNKQSHSLMKTHIKPSFKQHHKLLGYKRGIYSLYLPAAKQ